MKRRTLLAATGAAGLTAIAGCSSDGGGIPDTVTLEIDTDDSWSGSVDTDDGVRDISGSGDETFEWTSPFPSNIRVTIKKGPQADVPLEATFYADGEEVRSKSTSDPYESVIITIVPGSGA